MTQFQQAPSPLQVQAQPLQVPGSGGDETLSSRMMGLRSPGGRGVSLRGRGRGNAAPNFQINGGGGGLVDLLALMQQKKMYKENKARTDADQMVNKLWDMYYTQIQVDFALYSAYEATAYNTIAELKDAELILDELTNGLINGAKLNRSAFKNAMASMAQQSATMFQGVGAIGGMADASGAFIANKLDPGSAAAEESIRRMRALKTRGPDRASTALPAIGLTPDAAVAAIVEKAWGGGLASSEALKVIAGKPEDTLRMSESPNGASGFGADSKVLSGFRIAHNRTANTAAGAMAILQGRPELIPPSMQKGESKRYLQDRMDALGKQRAALLSGPLGQVFKNNPGFGVSQNGTITKAKQTATMKYYRNLGGTKLLVPSPYSPDTNIHTPTNAVEDVVLLAQYGGDTTRLEAKYPLGTSVFKDEATRTAYFNWIKLGLYQARVEDGLTAKAKTPGGFVPPDFADVELSDSGRNFIEGVTRGLGETPIAAGLFRPAKKAKPVRNKTLESLGLTPGEGMSDDILGEALQGYRSLTDKWIETEFPIVISANRRAAANAFFGPDVVKEGVAADVRYRLRDPKVASAVREQVDRGVSIETATTRILGGLDIIDTVGTFPPGIETDMMIKYIGLQAPETLALHRSLYDPRLEEFSIRLQEIAEMNDPYERRRLGREVYREMNRKIAYKYRDVTYSSELDNLALAGVHMGSPNGDFVGPRQDPTQIVLDALDSSLLVSYPLGAIQQGNELDPRRQQYDMKIKALDEIKAYVAKLKAKRDGIPGAKELLSPDKWGTQLEDALFKVLENVAPSERSRVELFGRGLIDQTNTARDILADQMPDPSPRAPGVPGAIGDLSGTGVLGDPSIPPGNQSVAPQQRVTLPPLPTPKPQQPRQPQQPVQGPAASQPANR